MKGLCSCWSRRYRSLKPIRITWMSERRHVIVFFASALRAELALRSTSPPIGITWMTELLLVVGVLTKALIAELASRTTSCCIEMFVLAFSFSCLSRTAFTFIFLGRIKDFVWSRFVVAFAITFLCRTFAFCFTFLGRTTFTFTFLGRVKDF